MNLKAVIRLVGINENTLRGWERRYQAVEPTRDEHGRRLYRPSDVERIKALWALVKEGHNIGRIAQLPTSALKKMIKSSLAPMAPQLTAGTALTEELLNNILGSLEKFNLEKLNQTLQAARFELSSKEIIINLISPLLVRIGQLVSTSALTIGQEHLMSALLRDYLGNMYQSLSPFEHTSRSHSKIVVLSTREGDLHEFGILLAGIMCNLYRYRTYYLGPNMPVDEMVEACRTLKADYVVLGLMRLPKQREIISSKDYLRQLDRQLPRRVTFCLGGSDLFNLAELKSDRQLLGFTGLSELDEFISQNL